MGFYNLWLVNLDTNPRQKIRIQNIPERLEVDPVANWASIPSMGRNNPFYHFTGGENIIRFTIDWYSRMENRQDVIASCRWVEGLTRNNEDQKAPRVLLIWGDLFKYTTWTVQEAPYNLEIFEPGNGILPIQAYQQVVMKRVMEPGENSLIENTILPIQNSPTSRLDIPRPQTPGGIDQRVPAPPKPFYNLVTEADLKTTNL